MHEALPAVRRSVLPSCVIMAAAVLAGCEKTVSDRDLTWITPAEAANLPATDRGFILSKPKVTTWVDPRSPEHYAEGHIPEAINIPVAELNAFANERLANADIVIVYGEDYSRERPVVASKRLIMLGSWDVRTLTGGLKAWRNAGFDVATGMPADATPSEDQAGTEAMPKPTQKKLKKG